MALKNITLITNVHFVEPSKQQALRLHASAIVMYEDPDGLFGNANNVVRFFGTEGSNDHGTLYLRDKAIFPFEIVKAKCNVQMLKEGQDEPEPIFSAGILKLACGVELAIFSDDSKKPFDIRTYKEITAVWDDLPGIVATYWNAPNMPIQQWHTPATIRAGVALQRRVR